MSKLERILLSLILVMVILVVSTVVATLGSPRSTVITNRSNFNYTPELSFAPEPAVQPAVYINNKTFTLMFDDDSVHTGRIEEVRALEADGSISSTMTDQLHLYCYARSAFKFQIEQVSDDVVRLRGSAESSLFETVSEWRLRR